MCLQLSSVDFFLCIYPLSPSKSSVSSVNTKFWLFIPEQLKDTMRGDTSIWSETDWIGRGLDYPTRNTPAIVLKQRKKLLAIPSTFQYLLPRSSISVQALLRLKLPLQSSSSVEELARDMFDASMPDTGLETIFKGSKTIPPPQILDELNDIFNQAWFDGRAQSVLGWNTSGRFPLPIISIWRELSRIHAVRAIWKKADEWMQNGTKKSARIPEMYDDILGLLGGLEWDTKINAPGSASKKTEDFGRLLGDTMIPDEMIDMLMHELADQVRFSAMGSTVTVAPLSFQMSVLSSFGTKRDPRERMDLARYADRICSGKTSRFYFPAHINGNHWVPFCIDVPAKTIIYGE